MSNSFSECPVCKLTDPGVKNTPMGVTRTNHVECPRCGVYKLSQEALDTIWRDGKQNPSLSAWIRSQQGGELLITESTLQQVTFQKYSVSEKQLLILRFLERNGTPGKKVLLTPMYDYPIASAEDDREFRYLLKCAQDRGLIAPVDPRDKITAEIHDCDVLITADGWDYLAGREKVGVLGDQVFVAMSFAEELVGAWNDGIASAIRRAGYNPYRVDAKPHLDRIDVKIMAEVKNSRFLVADVTGQRPGVYFEAGYAIGLGMPVFWSVREDEKAMVHFDTRQYNHIIWKDPQDLAAQLEPFVLAIIGRGGAKVSR